MAKSKKTKLKSRSRLSSYWQKFWLPATVFTTGGAVLVIEVVATRMLSPFFGNTIYTVSSVISVVLAALSVGYVVGGRLSDKRPTVPVFYSIIGWSGLTVLLLQLLNRSLLPELGDRLSIVSGPLISSVLLFFMPSLLLGMLSPFAVKLQSLRDPKQGVGSVAGGIFFWSTMGSIFGSLSAGYILIPYAGINSILLGVGSVLCVIAVIPLAAAGKKRQSIAILIGMVFFLSFSGSTKTAVLYEHDGVYEKLKITDITLGGRPTRLFQQDRSLSGGMDLTTGGLVFDYTKYYALYQLFTPDAKQALVIGGGAYSMPKALLEDSKDIQVDVAEIEPSLLDLGKKYFNVPDDPRLQNFTQDGRQLLKQNPKKYDTIISDVYYSLYSIPSHFTTSEFFSLAKSRLHTNGVFVANLIGSLARDDQSFIFSEMRTFQQAFPNSYFFAAESNSSLTTQNIMFVGYNSDRILDFNTDEVKNSPKETIRKLPSSIVDPRRYNLSRYPLLSDDYAPVEHLAEQTLRHSDQSDDRQLSSKTMLRFIRQQLDYGPRDVGSQGHKQTQDMITAELQSLTPKVTKQTWTDDAAGSNPVELTNIVGHLFPEKERRIILGTHYDTKRFASLDPNSPEDFVPGANDGASGVAVLLEFARYITHAAKQPNVGIDVVFFDGEEGNGTIKNDYTNWQPLGSTYFAQHLPDVYPGPLPELGMVVDMVCDKDLVLTPDSSAASYAYEQSKKFWDIGKTIDAKAFSGKTSLDITDDHSALNFAGIPSFVIIDLNYPHFHTTRDTLDKCSSKSLETVALTLREYIKQL